MIRVIQGLKLFAFMIFSRITISLLNAIVRSALQDGANSRQKSEPTPPSAQLSSGLGNSPSIEPKLFQSPNLHWFDVGKGIEEAKIRSAVFAFDDMPLIPGKFYFINHGFWWNA